MITAAGGRYLLGRGDLGRLVRYDTRWRRTQHFEVSSPASSELHEGANGAFLVVSADGDSMHASVRSAARPDVVVSTGSFDGDQWSFAGDHRAWASVPEFVVVRRGESSALLRIADDAKLDPLEGLSQVEVVLAVPESRLVVLAGAGRLTVWDHSAGLGVAQLSLVGGSRKPLMRFAAAGEELWVADGPTLLKLDTRQWEPLDAAGSEPEDQEINFWGFAADEKEVLVGRRDRRDVLVLDAASMLPVATSIFDKPLVDAAKVGSTVVGLDGSGRFRRSRLHGVPAS